MNRRSLVEKIKDRINETEQAGLILGRHRYDLNQALDEENLNFIVPQSVTARTVKRGDENYGFDILRCSRCGRMFYFREAVRNTLRCNYCSERPYLSSSPVFVANYLNRPPTQIIFSEAVRKINFDINSRHCIYTDRPLQNGNRLNSDFIKGVKESDSERPIDSLCWTCPIPNEPCEWRDDHNFCTYSAFTGDFRPDLWGSTQRVRVHQPQRIRTRSAFGTFIERYRPVSVSEGITKPVRIAVHDYSQENTTPVAFHKDELIGVEEILFVKKLEIYQFTIALAVGLPYVSVRRRPIRIFNEGSDEEEHPSVISRRLATEGLVVKLRNDVVKQIVDSWSEQRPELEQSALLNILYHTVSHAFLKPIPMMAGLDSSEFHESFSPLDNEVAVFDNSPGGIGGLRSVIEESISGTFLNGNYAAHLLKSLDCQLDCSWSCKACLHTNTCGWINRQLQRNMLRRIIDERTRNKYFGS